MPIYTSITEVIDYVGTALGDYAADHDVEAIARAISEWHNETDESGNILVNRSGLIITPEYAEDETGTSDAFWALVEDHAL